MEWSPRANIFEIQRLVEQFHDANICIFKKYLLTELKCDNEKEWLICAIKLLASSMSPESIARLRNKTIQLAAIQSNQDEKEAQVVLHVDDPQNSDNLSCLPSDIIDHIGMYLKKEESISIGYLNKQLYIESQKQSYLNKRWNDKALTLKAKMIDKFSWQESNPFAYSMPTELHIRSWRIFSKSKNANSMFTSHWFEKFFTRLNGFRCDTFNCLSFVPLNLLFGIKPNGIRNTIDYLDFRLSCPSAGQITPFCDRFLDFKKDMKSTLKSKLKSKDKDDYYYYYSDGYIKNIYKLRIHGYGWGRNASVTGRHGSRKLLTTFGKISQKIELTDCTFKVKNYQIKKIFDYSLITDLSIIGGFDCQMTKSKIKKKSDKFNINGKENTGNYNNTSDDDSINKYSYNKLDISSTSINTNRERIGKIEPIKRPKLRNITRNLQAPDSDDIFTLRTRDHYRDDRRFIQFLHVLDDYGVTKNIKRFTLHCTDNVTSKKRRRPHGSLRNQPMKDKAERKILDDILFNHFDQQVLLKTIVIKIHDNLCLSGVANIFLYLILQKYKLLNPLMCRIENIEIDISVRFNVSCTEDHKREIGSYALRNSIFVEKKDEDYDVNRRKVVANVSQCNDTEFGIIYRNICCWMRRIWQTKYNENVNKSNTTSQKQKNIKVKNKILLLKIQKSLD